MGAIPATAPHTPNKSILGTLAVERVVRKLNNDYGLGVEIPDPALSPARRKQLGADNEQYALCDRICRGILFLHYQRALDQTLAAFFSEAKAASLRWVPKPRADPRTLPSATTPPKAQTAGQQWSLQNILISVIDSVMAHKMTPLRIPARVSVPKDEGKPRSPCSPESPASIGSKRSFDSDNDHGPKRPRSGNGPAASPCPSPTPSSTFTDALDNVPTRQRLGRAPDWSSEHRRQDEEPSSSGATFGGSRGSSIFSPRGGQRSTQTTVGGEEDPEPKRPVLTIPSPPRFSVAYRAPTSSRPIFPPPETRGLVNAQQSPPRPSGSNRSNMAQSDFPDPADVSPSWDRQACSAKVNREPSALQLRLQNIWRKYLGGGNRPSAPPIL